ncbi:MAG: YlmC/YmxH family sporulation protein [Christensenellales bacterium]
MERFSSWRQKAVVNICDGRMLGYVCDLQIEPCDGKIVAIIVPGPCKFFGLVRGDKDFVIPWVRIKKIGEDVILVDIDDSFLKA